MPTSLGCCEIQGDETKTDAKAAGQQDVHPVVRDPALVLDALWKKRRQGT